MQIRHERAGDEVAIHSLPLAAFDPMPFSSGTGAAIVDALREAGRLMLPLVAVKEAPD